MQNKYQPSIERNTCMFQIKFHKSTLTDCVKYEKYVPTDLCNYL